MLDYCCPDCGKKLFEAEVPVGRIEMPCKRCGIVEPVYRGMVVSYRCGRCGRMQHCERPKQGRTHCIVCGTPSLTIMRPVEAPTPKTAG